VHGTETIARAGRRHHGEHDHQRDKAKPGKAQDEDRSDNDERRPFMEVAHPDLSSRIGVGVFVTVRGSRGGA
jgi:hypothetical protein